jgi:tripartite-type tricarboxylate transporter receptor subunit TctC
MKDIPALSETLPGFESTAWFAIVAPAKTPETTIAALNRAFNATLKLQDVQDRMAASGVELIGGSPSHLLQQMTTEMAKWADVIKQTGIRLD